MLKKLSQATKDDSEKNVEIRMLTLNWTWTFKKIQSFSGGFADSKLSNFIFKEYLDFDIIVGLVATFTRLVAWIFCKGASA